MMRKFVFDSILCFAKKNYPKIFHDLYLSKASYVVIKTLDMLNMTMNSCLPYHCF